MIDDTSTDPKILLLEMYDLIGGTTLNGVFYGIVFVLYCLYARLWYRQYQQEQQQRRHTVFSFTLAFLIFAVITVVTALQTRIMQLAYIDHSKFPGGPWAYEASASFIGKPDSGQFAALPVLSLIIDILTEGVQVWRLWNVWRGTQFTKIIIVLPLLLFFACTAFGLVMMADTYLFLPQEIMISIVIIATSLDACFTIFVTIMINMRLIWVRRQHFKAMGTAASEFADQYLSIATLLVESYALESAWVLVIAYLLVVYRVSLGRAWNAQTERQMSSLQWNHGSQSGGTDMSTSRMTQVPDPSTTQAELSPQALMPSDV